MLKYRKFFKVSNAGKIAGSKVISGEIKSKSKARIIRDGVVVYNGEISSLFREKNQVKEVGTGLECGISIKDFIDFKEKRRDRVVQIRGNSKVNIMGNQTSQRPYTQRQLRVGELVKQNLGELFIRNEAKNSFNKLKTNYCYRS